MEGKKILVLIFIGVFPIVGLVLASSEPDKPDSGRGILYVYEDSTYTTLKLLDSNGRYPVVPGETIYIHLDDLNDEEANDWSTVEIGVGTPDLGEILIGIFDKKIGDALPGHTPADPYVGDSEQKIAWVIGDTNGDGVMDHTWPESSTLVVHYRYNTLSRTFVARGPMTAVGHFHIIPELAGTLAGIAAMLGAYITLRQRRAIYS